MRLVLLLCAFIAGTLYIDASPAPLPFNCAGTTPGALARVRPGAWRGASRTAALPDRPGLPGPARMPQGHAHNDYEHRHPLLDALAAGFTSVEADVWAVDGRLLVAHDRNEVDPSRTLASLYLDPLARSAGSGPGDSHLQLLIDVKGDAGTILPLLRSELAAHAAILTSYRGCTVTPGPVSVVVSGNVPLAAPTAATTSLFGYDLHLERVRDTTLHEAVTPLVSARWSDYFSWDGQGAMSRDERERLSEIVGTAHAAGSAIRFWGTPNAPGAARDAVWHELAVSGVDYVSTNDLEGYSAFADRSTGARAPTAPPNPPATLREGLPARLTSAS